MKELTSRRTYVVKYFVTLSWIFSGIYLGVTIYNQFGTYEGFYSAPFFFLAAFVSYLPMRVAYDDYQLVVYDLFTRAVYRFEDVESLGFSMQLFSLSPYSVLKLTTRAGKRRVVRFLPKMSQEFKSLFSAAPRGLQGELIEAYRRAKERTADV